MINTKKYDQFVAAPYYSRACILLYTEPKKPTRIRVRH